jgi:Tfp pilus assembly protein PilF
MNSERIKLLQQFISDEPNNPFNVYALAMEFYHDQPERALELLVNLLHDHPNYLPSYYKAAHLYWERNERDLTDETFQSGIRLAEAQGNEKAIKELKAAYLSFTFEDD